MKDIAADAAAYGRALLEWNPVGVPKEVLGSARPRLAATPDIPEQGSGSGRNGEDAAAARLEAVRAELGDCRRCRLSQGRTLIVFGQGNPAAELMFIGEAPGADEDLQGLAFVGRAGQLLTDMIEKGMRMTRADVFIANVVKCRPPGNRKPETDEVLECQPFLEAQIRAIRPRVIVALGAVPAQWLTKSATPISRLRGRFAEWEGIPVMPTFHPAYLLRNPAAKRDVWEDLKLVMQSLGRPTPA